MAMKRSQHGKREEIRVQWRMSAACTTFMVFTTSLWVGIEAAAQDVEALALPIGIACSLDFVDGGLFDALFSRSTDITTSVVLVNM